MKQRAVAAMLGLACAAAACTPALNWREVRPEGSGLTAMFPCRPASQVRRLALAGATVDMALSACSVDGATYAVGFADLGQAQLIGNALDELLSAAARNVAAADRAAQSPLTVVGATPNPRDGRRALTGQLPDGMRVQEQVAVFAHGSRVFQATMIGSRLDDQAIETFFGGLSFAP